MDKLVLMLLLAGGAAAVPPTSAVVGWSTYLRAGPSQTAVALDELEHDVRVRVLACDNGWCRVSAAAGTGFIDRDALTLPRVPRPDAAARDCVVALQADAPRPTPTRFCSTTAPGTGAPSR